MWSFLLCATRLLPNIIGIIAVTLMETRMQLQYLSIHIEKFIIIHNEKGITNPCSLIATIMTLHTSFFQNAITLIMFSKFNFLLDWNQIRIDYCCTDIRTGSTKPFQISRWLIDSMSMAFKN